MSQEFNFETDPFRAFAEYGGEFEWLEFESDAGWQGEVSRGSRDYIRWVQQSLNKVLGLRLVVNGQMETQTRSAVRSFQQKRGLTVDGDVGPKTEAALVAVGAPPPELNILPQTSPAQARMPAAPVMTLAAPARSPGVPATAVNCPVDLAWIQSALRIILGVNISVDGEMGTQTHTALRTFQQKEGLPVTGNPDPQTVQRLAAALLSGLGPTTCSSLKPCEMLSKFDFDKDKVKPAHWLQLINVVRCVLASQKTSNPVRVIRVIGHASAEGDEPYNDNLGARRALQVERQLREKLECLKPGSTSGLTFEVKTQGESQPLPGLPNTAPGNRRVEICLVQPPAPVPPQQNTLTQTFKIVVKSFIRPIGISGAGSTLCAAIGIPLPPFPPIPGGPDLKLMALAKLTDAAYSEDPQTDIKNKIYRLFSSRTFTVSCLNGRISSFNATPLDTDVGLECLPTTRVCLTPPPIIIERNGVGPSGASSIDFTWRVKGRPHPAAEPAFLSVCPRLSVFIWHEVTGRIECTPSGLALTRLRITGSRFPSHRVWSNGAVSGFIPQGDFSNLWNGTFPSDPTLVR
jgi:outer membrane protein OmpA-like peptidoglycan-associated protein